MGQATADLPDPLAASSSGSTSTDDLLAQLAGEEIERLLAETDAPPESHPPAAPAPAVASQPATTALPAASSSTPSALPESKSAAAPVDDLEAIFTQFDGVEKGPIGVIPKIADPPQAPPIAPEPPSVAEELAAEMAEDAAQHARPASAAPAAKEIDLHESIVSGSSDELRAPSIFVKLLAVMSAPLDSFSDDTRDLIGKIAILTTLNALCVLAYVIFFRR